MDTARIAYQKYYERMDGHDLITGACLPAWFEMTTEHRAVWKAVVNAVTATDK